MQRDCISVLQVSSISQEHCNNTVISCGFGTWSAAEAMCSDPVGMEAYSDALNQLNSGTGWFGREFFLLSWREGLPRHCPFVDGSWRIRAFEWGSWRIPEGVKN